MNHSPDSKQADDFSLVLGGPLFQLLIRARLSTDTLGLVKRRVIFFMGYPDKCGDFNEFKILN